MEKIKAIERVEESLAKLPSVGKKSAERMAFALLDMNDDDLIELADSIKELKNRVHICPKCGNLCEDELCSICNDDDRDKTTILVVSYPKDIMVFEKSEGYRGLYHVLNGVISISGNKNVEDLSVFPLIERVKQENIKEVIIATNPTIEGETTALFLAKLLEQTSANVTRIAYGLPMGGNIDYTDSLTISKSIEGRRKM